MITLLRPQAEQKVENCSVGQTSLGREGGREGKVGEGGAAAWEGKGNRGQGEAWEALEGGEGRGGEARVSYSPQTDSPRVT